MSFRKGQKRSMPNFIHSKDQIKREEKCCNLVNNTSITLFTKDDQKSKLQIFKFYDFTKGGTDIVDQMNDYFKSRAKSLRWVMIVLYYMLDTTRVNAKSIWCIKEGIDFNRINSYDFGWDLAKCLATPHLTRRNLNGLGALVQLKMNLFLSKVLEQPEPKPEIEAKYDYVGKRKKCKLHYMNCRTIKERDNYPQSTEQCQVCGQSICCAHSLRICKKCLEK